MKQFTQVFLMVIVILGLFCATDLFLIRETTDRIFLISEDVDHEHAFRTDTLVRCYNCNKLCHIAANCFQQPNPDMLHNFRNQQCRQFNNGQYQQSRSHSHPHPRPNFNNRPWPQQVTFQNLPRYDTLNQ